MIRHRSQAQCRALIFRRDRGVCSLCGLDTEWVRQDLEGARGTMAADDFVVFRATYLNAHSLPLANKSLWIADHYPVPYSMGGTDAPDNLRTICTRPRCQAKGAPITMLAKTTRLRKSLPLKPMVRR